MRLLLAHNLGCGDGGHLLDGMMSMSVDDWSDSDSSEILDYAEGTCF